MNDNEEEAQQAITLPDPVEVLPPEMVQHMLSTLSPSSIAAASAASTRWRDLILSDSTLFREIDLSKLKSTWAMMPHFNRLSGLSRHNLHKVSVDLTGFWEEDEFDPHENDDEEIHPDEEDSQSESLKVTKEIFFDILQLSKESLKEVRLNIRSRPDDIRHGYHEEFPASKNALPFLTGLLQELSEFPHLKKISLKAPSFLSLKSGTDISGSKLFEIEDISWSDEKAPYYHQDAIVRYFNEFHSPRLDLMKHCREFTGTGLIEFGGGGWVYLSEAILEELWKSSSTLERINLEGFNFGEDEQIRSNIWKNATHCERLGSFRLAGRLPISDMDDEDSYVGADVVEDSFQFSRNSRRLVMKSFTKRLDWSVVSDMVGNDLEEFILVFDGMWDRIGFNDRGFLRCIVLRFQLTLRTISLTKVDLSMDVEPDTQDSLCFPNLQSLTLVDVQNLLLKVLSSIRAPKLLTISICCNKYTSSACDSLLTLLASHDAQLTTIDFVRGYSWADLDSRVGFDFSDLENLNLGENDENAAVFFSRFSFPNLKKITPTKFKHLFQEITSKLSDEEPDLSGEELET